MSWPVRYEVMAPTVATTSQRLEDALGNLESKVSEMVSHAVEKAVGAMKHSLAELLHAGQDEIEAAVRRLERRITRATEHQEIMIYSMKSDLDQFQAEMRSTIRDLHTMQAQTPDKREGATAQSEYVVRDQGQTPDKFDMPLFDGTDPDATAENLTSSSSDYKLSGRSVVAIENTGVKTPAVVAPTSNFQQDVNSQSTFSASPSGESASPIHTSWSNSRRHISNSFGNDTQLKIRESDKVDVKNTEKLEHVSSPLDNSTSAAVSASTASAFDSKPFSHSIPPNLPSSNSTEQESGNSSTINHSLTSASMTSSSTSINSPSIFAVKPPSFPIVPTTPSPSFSLEPVASLNFRNASVMGSSVPPANPFGSGTTVPTFGQPLVFDSKPFSHSIPPNLPLSNCTEQVFGSISIINHSLTSASMTSSSTSINSPSIFAVKPPSFPIVPTTPSPSFSLEPVASLNFRNASVMGSSVPPANPFGSGTTVPTFGQPLVSQSPPAFNFGSADPSASPFHFLGQQNQATPQDLPSFQTSNSLVNSGGSFSLGFGGGDKR